MKKLIPADAVLVPDQAKRVFEGQIYDVYQWQQQLYDGKSAIFEMLKRPDTVAAICIIGNKILVLNDEQPNRGAKLTFPGGRVDEGEAPDAAIRREVREETGYQFENWRLVKIIQMHNKIEWFIYTYLAWGETDKVEPHLDGGEIITVNHLALPEVKKLVAEKAGFLGESKSLFRNANSLDDLLQLPAFPGKPVDRP